MYKKLLSVLLVMVLLTGCGACRDGGGETANVTVTVKTAGGMALSGIRVSIWEGDTQAGTNVTDQAGRAVFPLPAGGERTVRLENVPLGYAVEETYPLADNAVEITLTSAPVPASQQVTGMLGVGDVMYDLTFTTVDGEQLTISEILEEKELVVLNFWFADCIWCLREFPVMEVAYQRYRENVEILALNPVDQKEQIAAFAGEHSLSFPMASCSRDLALLVGVGGYPTSVFIDRYGVICMIQIGAITGSETFYTVFDAFTGDDYEQKLYDSAADLTG